MPSQPSKLTSGSSKKISINFFLSSGLYWILMRFPPTTRPSSSFLAVDSSMFGVALPERSCVRSTRGVRFGSVKPVQDIAIITKHYSDLEKNYFWGGALLDNFANMRASSNGMSYIIKAGKSRKKVAVSTSLKEGHWVFCHCKKPRLMCFHRPPHTTPAGWFGGDCRVSEHSVCKIALYH